MKRLLAALAALSIVAAFASSEVRAPITNRTGTGTSATKAFGKLPLAFEPNVGQVGSDIKFLAHSAGATVLLGSDEAVLSVSQRGMIQRPNAASAIGSKPTPSNRVAITFAGANPGAALVPEDRLPGVSNYFIGNDPRAWRTNVPQYGRVVYRDLYPGIDVTFYGDRAGRLEYDLVVAPGADPALIQLAFQGADALDLDSTGDLVLHLGSTSLLHTAPVVYQVVGGERISVPGHYLLEGNRVGFAVGAFDRTIPLVIDPEVGYSTYLGGSGDDLGEEQPAVDGSGHVYICGDTDSTDFPISDGAYQHENKGGVDGFITKLSPDGRSVVYSTYLGGSGDLDAAVACAVDASGNLYVVGGTNSADFPTTDGAFQTKFQGGTDDGFVAKLNPGGSQLLYSTYLGGSGVDFTTTDDLALDPVGDVVVTGDTNSTDFPTTTGAYQTANAGGQGRFCKNPACDVVVVKLNATGTDLIYSTYLGGPGDDGDPHLALDAVGDVYVAYLAAEQRFPTTPGAFQPHFGGGSTDALVAKLDPTGSSLMYATYLGGGGDDYAGSIAVDATGDTYVGGFTCSRNFPVTSGAFQTKDAGGTTICWAVRGPFDGFIAEINPQGAGLVFSTYLGGSGIDLALVAGIDNSGRVVVAGNTNSTDFPVTPDAFQPKNHGDWDEVVAELSAEGSELIFSTYWGGTAFDGLGGFAFDGSDNLYLTGCTVSTDYPVTPGAFQTTFQGGTGLNLCGPTDAFVTKVAFDG